MYPGVCRDRSTGQDREGGIHRDTSFIPMYPGVPVYPLVSPLRALTQCQTF